jgi:hypothetical protein
MNQNSSLVRLFQEPAGLRRHGGAVAYAVLAYAASFLTSF